MRTHRRAAGRLRVRVQPWFITLPRSGRRDGGPGPAGATGHTAPDRAGEARCTARGSSLNGAHGVAHNTAVMVRSRSRRAGTGSAGRTPPRDGHERADRARGAGPAAPPPSLPPPRTPAHPERVQPPPLRCAGPHLRREGHPGRPGSGRPTPPADRSNVHPCTSMPAGERGRRPAPAQLGALGTPGRCGMWRGTPSRAAMQATVRLPDSSVRCVLRGAFLTHLQ
jgi:hypothetical protein